MKIDPSQLAIVYPMALLAVLSMAMLFFLLRERIEEMKRRRIHPQKVASSSQMGAMLENTRGADHYRNLFEMPVLFYVLGLALMVTGSVTPTLLALAWVYVVLRFAHAFIHVGYNKVMHRLTVFALSATVLAIMWVLFVLRVAQAG